LGHVKLQTCNRKEGKKGKKGKKIKQTPECRKLRTHLRRRGGGTEILHPQKVRKKNEKGKSQPSTLGGGVSPIPRSEEGKK